MCKVLFIIIFYYFDRKFVGTPLLKPTNSIDTFACNIIHYTYRYMAMYIVY